MTNVKTNLLHLARNLGKVYTVSVIWIRQSGKLATKLQIHVIKWIVDTLCECDNVIYYTGSIFHRGLLNQFDQTL
jgi:hypothetical protein